MPKSATTSNKPRKQHTPEFRQEALKLAECIGVAATARELSLYESQLYAQSKKLKNAHSSSEREQEMTVEIARLKRQLAERDEEWAEFSIKAICRVLRVTRSGWYAWRLRRHQPNQRQQFRLVCDAAVRQAFNDAKQRYSAPRLADELPE